MSDEVKNNVQKVPMQTHSKLEVEQQPGSYQQQQPVAARKLNTWQVTLDPKPRQHYMSMAWLQATKPSPCLDKQSKAKSLALALA